MYKKSRYFKTSITALVDHLLHLFSVPQPCYSERVSRVYSGSPEFLLELESELFHVSQCSKLPVISLFCLEYRASLLALLSFC
jgi:hypothetical protein